MDKNSACNLKVGDFVRARVKGSANDVRQGHIIRIGKTHMRVQGHFGTWLCECDGAVVIEGGKLRFPPQCR